MPRSVSRWRLTHCLAAYAARANATSLSFAVNYGTLPVNSLGNVYTTKIEFQFTPNIKTRKPYTNMALAKWVEPIPSFCFPGRRAFDAVTSAPSLFGITVPIKSLWWRWRESSPRLSAFNTNRQRLCIMYNKLYIKSQELFLSISLRSRLPRINPRS